MLDVAFIRENADLVKEGMKNKGEPDSSVVDRVIEKDEEWRSVVTELDNLRAESNKKAKKIGQLMGQGKKEEAQKLIKETGDNKEKIKELEDKLSGLEKERSDLLYQIPNVPDKSVPVGHSEEDNEVYLTWGETSEEEWRKPHWEIAEKKGWIDFERGSKVTGAGFPFYVGAMARLQRALINFFLNEASEKGYTELQAPYFVNEDSARGTGQIPDKEDMMYTIPRDGFFAIPTAEVPVTNFHRDEIFSMEDLPVYYSAYTPCWRREAGSYGKDVRGLNRLHQFDKVELVKIVHPDSSDEELESLREYAESLLKKLELPYRTLLMCTGDMGFTQTKKYDLEVWSPGQHRWLEVSSCSNFGSFQARRMQLRYKNEKGKTEILHTLNGSGLALPRIVASILETYQTEDGDVLVPDVLQPYMNSEKM
ncbi:serine--tRNA ligase [Rhodohalobacter sulfatireducens]|uniref:Serine--tRNA ligase n=1 Tax=Rhodohalobacter sulfatireducens TaxID=2911366 RepID=A0ABS9KIP3_9BACT|nr:serine--tRNA ligase [Rhodohalobacter sulfatireducens]MCG2590699.1 serine--tRNA ligase [Rhodohalobacter sulfatireducens]